MKYPDKKLGRYRKGVNDGSPKTPEQKKPSPSGWVSIVAKYDGTCSKCRRNLVVGTIVWFNPKTRKAKHSYPCGRDE